MIEILWRNWRGHGYPHIIIAFVGGLALATIGLLNERKQMSLLLQGLIGCAIITILELIIGVILHNYFNMKLWDYSGMFLSYKGYTSFVFSVAWFFASILSVFVDDVIRHYVFGQPFKKYKL